MAVAEKVGPEGGRVKLFVSVSLVDIEIMYDLKQTKPEKKRQIN